MNDRGGPPTSERRRKLLGIKLRALVAEHLGIATDAEGRASLGNLWVCGEVASTGASQLSTQTAACWSVSTLRDT